MFHSYKSQRGQELNSDRLKIEHETARHPNDNVDIAGIDWKNCAILVISASIGRNTDQINAADKAIQTAEAP